MSRKSEKDWDDREVVEEKRRREKSRRFFMLGSSHVVIRPNPRDTLLFQLNGLH